MNNHEIMQEILRHTSDGLDVFNHYLDNIPANIKKHFKIRDEKSASSSIKKIGGKYLVSDWGGELKGADCVGFLMSTQTLSFRAACNKIILDMSLPIDSGQQSDDWKYPKIKNQTELPNDMLAQLFEKRGLTQSTILKFKLFTRKVFFIKAGRELTALSIPYYEGDKIVNVKNRGKFTDNDGTIRKDYQLEKDGKKSFFNINALNDNTDSAIITEGEIDCMSVCQAIQGTNLQMPCISVSNGINSLETNIKLSIEAFQSVKVWYVFVDNDEAGAKLEAEVIRRAGKQKCRIVKKYGYKDASEMLSGSAQEQSEISKITDKDARLLKLQARFNRGTELILKALSESEFVKIEGLITLNNVYPQIENIYKYGRHRGFTTGHTELDSYLRYTKPSFTVLTGIPSHGKSTFLNDITIRLAANHDWKFGIYSPEFINPEDYYIELLTNYVGKHIDGAGMDDSYVENFPNNFASESELKEGSAFINEHFFTLSPEIDKETKRYKKATKEYIFAFFEDMVARHGVDAVIIDPFNKVVREDYIEIGWLNEFLTDCVFFAKMFSVHVFLVAHPTKMRKGKEEILNGQKVFIYDVPGIYDIFGGSEFANQAFNIISIYRNFLTNLTEIHISKVKQSHTGKNGIVEMTFNPSTRRFTCVNGEASIPLPAIPTTTPTQISSSFIANTPEKEDIQSAKIYGDTIFEGLSQNTDDNDVPF